MIFYEEKDYHACDHHPMFSFAEYCFAKIFNWEYLPESFDHRDGFLRIYAGNKKRYVCRYCLRAVH